MPTSDVIYDEAIALQQAGRVEEAIEKLHQLLAVDPDYPLAHAALSVFFSRLDKHDQAIEHAEKVCQLEPDDPFSYVALSLLCQKAGRMESAERALMMARQAQVAAYQRRMES